LTILGVSTFTPMLSITLKTFFAFATSGEGKRHARLYVELLDG
jgi:hypothetical protein